MNLTEDRYSRFALVREMLAASEVAKNLDTKRITALLPLVKERSLLSGEGSSRIFPAKRLIATAWREGWRGVYATEACTQALEYNLMAGTVFVASNSGRTKEGVRLIRHLRAQGHKSIIGVVANGGTPIADEADASYILSCGPESAVAASKSVLEQALFYDVLLRAREGLPPLDLQKLSRLMRETLEAPLPEALVAPLARSTVIHWAGRNDGVAEELTLKTNEIARKRADFLEGTYAVHGIEEVMEHRDSVIVMEPFADEEEKFAQVLQRGVGLSVVAVATRQTSFPTILVPEAGPLTPYLLLMAGWNLLVEIGLRLDIELDKPKRARKVGNEVAD